MTALIARDVAGMARVCGPTIAARWLLRIGQNLRQCKRAQSLTPADLAMGPGPFAVRSRTATATLYGDGVMGGIREIWIRDVYLSRGFLSISPNATVVDLGANMGNFSLLALGHGPGVRVVCAEANPAFVEKLKTSLAMNGWSDRARIIQAFLGDRTRVQSEMVASGIASGSEFLSEAEFLQRADLVHIDFLKCDIEGSERALLRPSGRLLAMTRQIAVEVHGWAIGNEDAAEALRRAGFDVLVTHESPDGAIMLGRRCTQAHDPAA